MIGVIAVTSLAADTTPLVTFVFATHDPRVVELATRIVRLRDGAVESDQNVGQ